jgi:hypothetical protein
VIHTIFFEIWPRYSFGQTRVKAYFYLDKNVNPLRTIVSIKDNWKFGSMFPRCQFFCDFLKLFLVGAGIY